MTYWLVDEAPTPATVNRPDLCLMPDESGVPHLANRLLALSGWTLDQFLMTFPTRRHLWSHPNRIWLAEARKNAHQIAEKSLAEGADGVVVLGMRAAAVFNLAGEEPMEWVGRFAFMPMPSGQARYWSNGANKIRARAFFASLLNR